MACVVSLVMFSCNSGSSGNVEKDKKYLYIEVSGSKTFGEYQTKIDTIEIIAKNDSLAYLDAFRKSCISQKASLIVAEQMKKLGSNENYETIHGFRLLNEKIEEVGPSIVPDSVLEGITKSIFSVEMVQK